MDVINLADKLGRFDQLWSPRVVAQVNDYHVKLAKVQGEFVRHRHDDTDELFLVVKGSLLIRLPDGDVRLGPGDLFVVPRGVDHQPFAEEETHVLLLEPAGTRNTGDVADERTVADPERI